MPDDLSRIAAPASPVFEPRPFAEDWPSIAEIRAKHEAKAAELRARSAQEPGVTAEAEAQERIVRVIAGIIEANAPRRTDRWRYSPL